MLSSNASSSASTSYTATPWPIVTFFRWVFAGDKYTSVHHAIPTTLPMPREKISEVVDKSIETTESAVLHRNLCNNPPIMTGGKNNWICYDNVNWVFDAQGGAGVACFGRGIYDTRIAEAHLRQMQSGIAWGGSLSYSTQIAEDYARAMVQTTNGQMARFCVYQSGTDAVEAGVKLCYQYWCVSGEPSRVNIISRHKSYHGNSLTTLALSGHLARREIYEPLLSGNFPKVSACNPIHDRGDGESDWEYVARKAKELEDEIKRLGPETVAAFFLEPVVGAAMGCVPAVPGYLKAMREVCDKYRVLLVFDEIMCGMGRCGDTLHAWQKDDVAPDIELLGKAMGAGFEPVDSLMIGHRVANKIKETGGDVLHGHTYQNHPLSCAVGLEVLNIIMEKGLLKNITKMGNLLSKKLKGLLADHPNVLEIRGPGLFIGIEIVKNKTTKEPFSHKDNIVYKLKAKAHSQPYAIDLYSSTGCVDGWNGDALMIMPAYTITKKDVDHIAERTAWVIRDFFNEL